MSSLANLTCLTKAPNINDPQITQITQI